jgi:hypothetical protein
MGVFIGDLYRCKDELLLHGVPSVEDGTGVWYCRRMVKETGKAEKCSESGRKGGGNPSLNKEKDTTDTRIPEARSHISIKGTFKGANAQRISDIESVINCRPEFARLKPEVIATEIHKAEGNACWKNNLEEFLADAANSLECPRNPTGMLRAYLNRALKQNNEPQKRKIREVKPSC